MKTENWSVLLAFKPWDAQELVHLVGKSTLSVAQERAKEISQERNAKHYLVIRTDQINNN